MKARAGCFALVALALSGSAVARQHPRVQLELDACVRAPHEEVRRLLAIELGALLDEHADPGADRTRVRVDCAGAETMLHVEDPISRRSIDRPIDLGATSPIGSARLLALAITELVTASWSELTEPPRAARAPVAAQPVLEAPPLERLRLSALGLGRGTFAGAGFLGGAALRLSRYHARHLGWLVELEVAHGSAAVSVGSVSTTLLSIGTAFVAHQSWRKIGIHGGIGLRFGAAQLRGESDAGARGASFWGPWVGPMATLGLVAAPVRRLALELGLEGGYVVTPVGGLVDGRREVAVEGGWIGLYLGLGVFL